MIQRLQSIFLFLSFAAGAAALFLPVAHFYKGFTFPVDLNQLLQTDNIPFLVSGGLIKLAAFLSLIGIFLFKKRKRQINIVRVAQFLLLALLIYGIYLFYPFTNTHTTLKGWPLVDNYLTRHFAIFLPFVMYFFNAAAIQYIKSDEKLVRSMDRLR